MTTKKSDLSLQIHGTSLKELVFDFYAILKIEEARKQFYSHLATEFNTEPLDFILAVEALESTSSIHDASKMAYDICELYIQPLNGTDTAKKQINVSASTLSPVIATLKANGADKSNWTQGNITPAKLFEPVKNGIILELYTESFPRYFCFVCTHH